MLKLKKQQKKICMRCKKEISDSENYYAFVEYNNKKVIFTNHAHRKCWDDFLQQVSSVSKAQEMLERLEEPLTKMGLLKEKEMVIQ